MVILGESKRTPYTGGAMTEKKGSTSKVDWKAVIEGQKDFLKPLVQEVIQQVLEAEMVEVVGADRHERTEGRQGYRRRGREPRCL
jgi:transposase-like protein